MIQRLTLLTILSLLASGYSSKEQFQKENHDKTLRQEEVDPRTVIGGALGGKMNGAEIQREEERIDTLEKANCEEALRYCESKESNSLEP